MGDTLTSDNLPVRFLVGRRELQSLPGRDDDPESHTAQPTRGVHKSAFSPSHLGSGLATARQVGLMVNRVLLDTYSK